MTLTPRAPLKWGGIKSTWLSSLPSEIEILTIDTNGNVSRQAISSTNFEDITGDPEDNSALSVIFASLQSDIDAKIGGSTGSNDNRLLRANGTDGATVQDSAITVDDSGNASGLGTVGCGAITSSGNLSCRNITQTSSNVTTDGLNFVNSVSGTTGRIQAGYAGNYDTTLLISSGNPNTAAISIGSESQFVKPISVVGAATYINHSSNGNNRIDFRTDGAPGLRLSGLTQLSLQTGLSNRLTLTATEATFLTNLTVNGLVALGTYTVTTLPSASANAGRLAQVTDSSITTNGSTVAGSGANRAVVYSNGTDWKVVVA